MRKESDVEGKVQEALRRPDHSTINVDRVTERLEGVKADSDRQHQVQPFGLNGGSQKSEGLRKAFSEKIIVFENK